MSIVKNEFTVSKSRWPVWLSLCLVLALSIGVVVVEFDNIKGFFKPSSPVELAEQAMIKGNEQQRLDALALIKKDRLQVNVKILKKVFSSDSNLRVRQLALEILVYRMERRAAKKFLEQVLPMESDPKILQMINYKIQKLSEEISWLYKE